MYKAAIPKELGFGKGDVLAVIRHQDDGWWEAEVHGGSGQVGLVPGNYLQHCGKTIRRGRADLGGMYALTGHDR